MSTVSSTIRIKLGPIEVECTATEAFLKAELPVLMQSMIAMHRVQLGSGVNQSTGTNEQSSNGTPGVTGSQLGDMTTKTIAARLSVKSGSDLVLAACLRLARSDKSQYKRQEILEAMKEATGYYKVTHSNNLSTSLNTLVKQKKLLEQASEVYALSGETKKELEGRLGASAES